MAIAEIRLFKERPLECHSVLYVDAEYQRVHMNGSVIDEAVLQAVGINAEGRREVVGMSVSTGEAEVPQAPVLGYLEDGAHGFEVVNLHVSPLYGEVLLDLCKLLARKFYEVFVEHLLRCVNRL